MPATPRLLRAYFEDQARPIGSGWRWVFAKEGHRWVTILDPWNRYTVRIPMRRWPTIGKRLTLPAEDVEVLRQAKRRLRRLLDAEGPTKFEAECLAVTIEER